MDACIKNISEDKWRYFKAESAKQGMKMGEFFDKIIQEHKNNNEKGNAYEILCGPKPLKGMLNDVDWKKIRKEFNTNVSKRL